MAEQLALHGGEPTIHPGELRRFLPQAALAEVFDKLASGDAWTKYEGEYGERLCGDLKKQFDRNYVRLASSGTVAVEIALKAVGVEAGEEVLLAGYDFPGNFRAVEAVGARPCLVDLAPNRWVIDAGALSTHLEKRNRTPKAIIVSHLHGDLAPIEQIVAIADQHGLTVVEDACQSPGAVISKRPVGSWGQASVLSFGGTKLLTAGRGGAVLFDDPACKQRAAVYADRGNNAFPMSELQAAVLLPQLGVLKEETQRRHEAWLRLRESTSAIHAYLKPLPGNEPLESDPNKRGDLSAYYKVGWMLGASANQPRAKWIAALQAEGLPVGKGFRGFAKRSAKRCEQLSPLTAASLAAEQTVLLDHTALNLPLVNRIADGIRKVAAYLDNT